ncbi:MAG: hypothetical protein JWM68_718 [Verrucomicrobiales bacterium]|nr:hypothetical protein [Verrucomicrobiales bacterium]
MRTGSGEIGYLSGTNFWNRYLGGTSEQGRLILSLSSALTGGKGEEVVQSNYRRLIAESFQLCLLIARRVVQLNRVRAQALIQYSYKAVLAHGY